MRDVKNYQVLPWEERRHIYFHYRIRDKFFGGSFIDELEIDYSRKVYSISKIIGILLIILKFAEFHYNIGIGALSPIIATILAYIFGWITMKKDSALLIPYILTYGKLRGMRYEAYEIESECQFSNWVL
ncbi:hypothetical protein V9J15_04255 [Candidatus Liberibacter africanus]|uniref:hypothetical protein n=1 Tax=Liberibacter africanus TaxID=34020 RepID=UPI00339D6B5C